jgi:choline dehydrogenase-like flavoprotein
MTSHPSSRNPSLNFYDVIVLGAGAAGLMCASVAGQRGRSVLLLEQARQPAEKIRISGGGRCNFTNLHTSPANFLSDNPRFCTSALSGYTQRDFMALVDSYNIAHHEKTKASCSVTAPRGRSSTCCWRNAARRMRNCAWVYEYPRCRRAKAALSWSPIKASFAADHW